MPCSRRGDEADFGRFRTKLCRISSGLGRSLALPNRNFMNGNLQPGTSGDGNEGARTGVIAAVLLVGIAVVGGAVFFYKTNNKPATPPPAEQTAEQTPKPRLTPKRPQPAEETPTVAAAEPVTPAPAATPASAPVSRPAPAAPARPEPSAYTRSLVNTLSGIDLKNGPLTPEKVEAWKQALATLKQQGAAGVPAIMEYLEKNTDISFGEAGKDLGASSVRLALLESLASMTGPEALQASLQVLQTTTMPSEIAYLAASLDTQYPGQYQAEILRAARDTIQMAAENKLPGVDVGPLFQAMAKHGGAGVVADLESLVSNYRYYGVISLGQLPDNAGVNSLIEMAKAQNNPARNPALQMLAQASLQSPDAKAAFLAQARDGSIPYATWVTIFDVLGGHRFYIGNPAELGGNQPGDKTWQLAGNKQQFFVRETPMSADEANTSLALAKELMAGSNDQAVKDGLQQVIGRLESKLPK